MQIILYAIPVFIALILIEWVYRLLRGRNNYRIADTIASISLGSISRFRGLLGIGLAGLAYDFSYYWFHRISHEANLFWAAHVVHHQSEDYNLGTALRQSGSGVFGFIFYLPWLVLGIPLEILLAAGAINLVYQFWVHTQHINRLGPLEWVLITPSNHRVHHAQNAIYIDRNYGGMLVIWDRIFGSFQDELPGEPCIYGIRKPLHSYNPLWAARMCTGARCRMPGARNGGWTSEESGSKVRAGVLRTWKRVTRPRKPSCSISLNMRSMSRLPNGIMPFSSLSAP